MTRNTTSFQNRRKKNSEGAPSPQSPYHLFTMATSILIRDATLADLDAMVDVYLAAFPMDPVWSYVFSNHHRYPEETCKLTRLEFTEYLENKHGKLRFLVAEVPKTEDENVMGVAAICLWKVVVGPEARPGK